MIQTDLHCQHSLPSLTVSIKSSSSQTPKEESIHDNTNIGNHKRTNKRRETTLAKRLKMETVIRNKWKQPWALSTNQAANSPRHQAARERRDNLTKGKKKLIPIQLNEDVSRMSGGFRLITKTNKLEKNNALSELKNLFENEKNQEKKSIRSRIEIHKKEVLSKQNNKSEKPNYFSKSYLNNILKSINIEETCQAQNDVIIKFQSTKLCKIQKSKSQETSPPQSPSPPHQAYHNRSIREDFHAYVHALKDDPKNFKPIHCYIAAVNDWSRFTDQHQGEFIHQSRYELWN